MRDFLKDEELSFVGSFECEVNSKPVRVSGIDQPSKKILEILEMRPDVIEALYMAGNNLCYIDHTLNITVYLEEGDEFTQEFADNIIETMSGNFRSEMSDK